MEEVWLRPLISSKTEAGGKMPGYHPNAKLCLDIGAQNERPIRTGRVKDGSIEEVRISYEEIVLIKWERSQYVSCEWKGNKVGSYKSLLFSREPN